MSRKLEDLSTDELMALRKVFSGRDELAAGSRADAIVEHSMDVKFSYHVVRLLYEVEQIMLEGDLDLQRHREHLKAIRRGDMSMDAIEEWMAAKEKDLEAVYHSCKKIPHGPREAEIKQLLLECLEHHYGSLDACVITEDKAVASLRRIAEIAQEGLV